MTLEWWTVQVSGNRRKDSWWRKWRREAGVQNQAALEQSRHALATVDKASIVCSGTETSSASVREDPTSASEPPEGKVASGYWSLDKLPAAASVLGVFLYGLTRLGQETFCSRFGVTPEELGLSYAFTLARTGTLLLALVPWFAFVVGAAFLVRFGRKRWARATWVLATALGAYAGWDWIHILMPRYGAIGAMWGTLAVLGAFGFAMRLLDGRKGAPALLLLFTTAGVWFAAIVGAQSAAEVLKAGEGGSAVLGTTAYRAQVSGLSVSGMEASGAELTVLGRSSGRIVLYSKTNSAILIVPDQDVTVVRKSP